MIDYELSYEDMPHVSKLDFYAVIEEAKRNVQPRLTELVVAYIQTLRDVSANGNILARMIDDYTESIAEPMLTAEVERLLKERAR